MPSAMGSPATASVRHCTPKGGIMVNRTAAALVAATFLSLQCLPSLALAENQMGYQLLSAEQAAGLSHSGGALGMDIGRAQQITNGGMTFDLLRVNGVRRGSSGAQAGFNVGDQIIAADGRVFQNVATFAAYVGSLPPGRQITVDYMPANGGPQQAQRVVVTVGAGGRAVPAQTEEQAHTGMSTGSKVAIGVGAAALFGCYKLGCFNRSAAQPGNAVAGSPNQPR